MQSSLPIKSDPVSVGFVLQEHFSMVGFTAAVDALVTTNLVSAAPLFVYETIGLDSSIVTSDLGIEVSANDTIDELILTREKLPDMLIVCGGLRCSTVEHHGLSALLKQAAKHDTVIGGIWNGAIALAHAGLLDNQSCAVHPEDHVFMREQFPRVNLTNRVLVVDSDCLSCAGPISALDMMVYLIGQKFGKPVTRAVREILSCDQYSESSNIRLNQSVDDSKLPKKLRELMALMAANIEEPISAGELCALVGISRRQAERLFQNHLEITPRRYYLGLRIIHAHHMLLQTNASILEITLASGFVSTSHFSKCYKNHFDISPTMTRENR